MTKPEDQPSLDGPVVTGRPLPLTEEDIKRLRERVARGAVAPSHGDAEVLATLDDLREALERAGVREQEMVDCSAAQEQMINDLRMQVGRLRSDVEGRDFVSGQMEEEVGSLRDELDYLRTKLEEAERERDASDAEHVRLLMRLSVKDGDIANASQRAEKAEAELTAERAAHDEMRRELATVVKSRTGWQDKALKAQDAQRAAEARAAEAEARLEAVGLAVSRETGPGSLLWTVATSNPDTVTATEAQESIASLRLTAERPSADALTTYIQSLDDNHPAIVERLSRLPDDHPAIAWRLSGLNELLEWGVGVAGDAVDHLDINPEACADTWVNARITQAREALDEWRLAARTTHPTTDEGGRDGAD